ncbi:hypothetical protein GCM10025858_28190 [Alicyclobacillus sacchari]|nr:hypothetical protein GCM10025858_28190 [Alicyclobacillus sacchari]
MSIESYKPGLENVIACETSISYLDVEHEEIVIRGYDLIDLAKKLSYVDVIGLLLDGRLPSADEREGIERALSEQDELPEAIYTILGSLLKHQHIRWTRCELAYLRFQVLIQISWFPR